MLSVSEPSVSLRAAVMIDNAVIDSNNTLEVASNSTLALPITG
jgi:hypothetical protein